jgi:hypothetical protein
MQTAAAVAATTTVVRRGTVRCVPHRVGVGIGGGGEGRCSSGCC